MFGKKAQPPIKSLIAQGTRIEGNMKFTEGLRVDGEVYGDIVAGAEEAGSLLVISEASVVQGAITADHLVVECLHMLDPRHPETVLGVLPSAVLERMLKYVREYQPESMRTNYGPQPALDQVTAARIWIESKAQERRLCL